MPIGQLITLGVGTPSSVPILDLTGLFPSQIVANQGIGSIPIGPGTNLIGNVVYALPARKVNFTWQSSGAALIDVSINGTDWTTADSTASSGIKTVELAAVFVRPSANVTVILRKVKARL